ncbi:hypothetical protein TD95_003498 [Thielaviopsis punctulata]|uniref:Inositol polyphosphate-related phosphatase domain-containing protein n=1 Tax=Thielaviopsis punctulata TaxID=72032 RepID=A0A0F4ZKJ7_9PEZI|nr:hypothetical protein TD95_003498 [Thielaviopsis punctulata]
MASSIASADAVSTHSHPSVTASTAASTTVSTLHRNETIESDPVEIPSGPTSMARAVYARRPEYTRPHRIRVKIGTWNVAQNTPSAFDLRKWFFQPSIDGLLEQPYPPSNRKMTTSTHTDSFTLEVNPDAPRQPCKNRIGLYVLALQEATPATLGQRIINTDPVIEDHWSDAIADAVPPGYTRIVREVMAGIIMIIYAATELADTVSHISSTQVGTGLLGYMGNKGAVSARLLLGETTRLLFTNSHLASGNEAQFLERRCWDTNQIKTRTEFAPVSLPGGPDSGPEKIGDEDLAFWVGDLNFRLDAPGEDIRSLFSLHTQGMYGAPEPSTPISLASSSSIMEPKDSYDSDTDTILSPRSGKFPFLPDGSKNSDDLPNPDDFITDEEDDPLSLQTTLNSLLPHDQLRQVIRQKKAFHDGWKEGAITFMPTYKYDIGSRDNFDSSEKQRAPSWCDRILYRTRLDLQKHLQKVKEEEEAKRLREEAEQAAEEEDSDPNVLFSNEIDYDEEPEKEEGKGNEGGEKEPQPSSEQPARTSWGYDEYDEYDENEDSGDQQTTATQSLERIRLEQYWSVQSITSSDHKPVVGLFTVDYDAVVPELRAIVQAEVARDFDRAENEGRPDITIVIEAQSLQTPSSSNGQGETVDFGPVQVFRKYSQTLTVANTGQGPATFSFLEHPAGSDCQSWLTASFVALEISTDNEPLDLGATVTLQPGDTVGIQVDVCVDDFDHIRDLNSGTCRLDQVLVLRVENGRDHFLPVHGTWLPSCIGRSLNELIRVPDGGIRVFMAEFSLAGSIPDSHEVRCSAPKELFKLVESLLTLTERAIADESMLEGAEIPRDNMGWPYDEKTWLLTDATLRMAHKETVAEALDLDRPVLEAFPAEIPALTRVEIVAEMLLIFLRTLTDGIITANLWTVLEERLPQLSTLSPATAPSKALEDAKTAILDILSTDQGHSISLVFLASTLGRVCAELSPVSRADIKAAEIMQNPGGLSFARFRRNTLPMVGEGAGGSPAAVAQRRARERRVAEVFTPVVCRVPSGEGRSEREKKAVMARQMSVLEVFVHPQADF